VPRCGEDAGLRPSLPRRSPIQSDRVAYFSTVATGLVFNRRQHAYGTTEAANAAAASSDSEFSSDDGYRMPARGSDPEISWPIECLS
ncbi:hypothetical protein KQR54_32945, partial [Mycobacterium gordonae]|uniref:hypothetical protein n=1 Tax=Mycobacterium gordonae TaxID=1778 RepID=UPI00210DEFA1